ncbi:MAG TPA: peptide chain release factor 1 [Planctomycetota bacterium]|jgi:peptide chain release factor 1|nr:peptide chain release factor 1 [Planctomycetota bacterium]
MSSLYERIAPQLSVIEARFEELEGLLADSHVASQGAKMVELLRERGRIESTVALARAIRALDSELKASEALRESSSDSEMQAYCDEVIAEVLAKRERLEQEVLEEFVKDEDEDVDGAILEIRAGTGGDEASLWAGDLLRMYIRFCEREGFRTEILSISPSEVSGVKEVFLQVKGKSCFSILKYESGGHRVQRVPTTETQGRIHTSAATVAVLPEASEVQVAIHDQDLRIDSFRSSGPGGQSVNKTSSAIRITHEPSGLVVSCQDEKSQHKNKAKALAILRSRLYDLERQRIHDERSSKRKSLIGSGDRSERIRTYNFPQSRVTDHRINLSQHNLVAVLDGDLDSLLKALCDHDREDRLQALASGNA